MDWRVKALLQKWISYANLGDKLNHLPARFKRNYYSNGATYHLHEALRMLDNCSFDSYTGKTALEIGTGYFLYQPLILHLLGFAHITTVDITKDITFRSVKKQLKCLDSKAYLKLIASKGNLSLDQIQSKLYKLKNATSLHEVLSSANITYIPFYHIHDLRKNSAKYDYIFSQVVMEHIRPVFLEHLFKEISKSLRTDGYSVHTINFIDHFTNDGLFKDHQISEFNFLKYSDKYWEKWAGNSIAYTNRLGHPYYLQLCFEHHLKVVDFIGENYKEQIPFDVKLIHSDIIKRYKPDVNRNDLTEFQRGTLIFKR
ncbi:MAG: class I SAM-dependent methyltransferase [Bacteroidia bacterium]